MKKIGFNILVNCIIPILCGTLIYVGYRPTSLNYFSWFSELGLANNLLVVRKNISSLWPKPANWIVYSLPDGLWAYSFIFSIKLIWNEKQGGYWIWTFISYMIILLPEILQFNKILPGTYDIQDIALLLLGIILSSIVLSTKKYEYEKTI